MKHLVAALLASSAVLASVPVQAQSFEQSALKGLLSTIGLTGDDKPPIEYRERAPLVVPGRLDALPPPQGSVAARNPAWPNDPDAAAARAKAEADATPARDPTERLSRAELAAGARVGAGRLDGRQIQNRGVNADGTPNMYDKEVLGGPGLFARLSNSFTGKGDNEVVPFTGEPARTSLVEPPRGFRTPAADAPYGPIGKRVDEDLVLGKKKKGPNG